MLSAKNIVFADRMTLTANIKADGNYVITLENYLRQTFLYKSLLNYTFFHKKFDLKGIQFESLKQKAKKVLILEIQRLFESYEIFTIKKH